MSNRTATQEFTVRDVLIRYCSAALTPGTIDVVSAELMAEITKGPTTWAFSDEADHLRVRVAFLTGEIYGISERLTLVERRNATLTAMVFRLASKGSEVSGFPEQLMREARLLIQPTESGASE